MIKNDLKIYYAKVGTYIIPTEIMHEIVDEFEEQERHIKEANAEIERLNNIIKRLEENLREMYLTFGEFSEEYTENIIKKLKGEKIK